MSARPVLVVLAALAAPAAADDERTAAEVAAMPPPGQESGRLDAGDQDSVVRDVAQGVLVIPRAAVEVAFAPVRAGVWFYDRYRLGDRFKQIFFDDTETYGLYPTLHYDTSDGLTFGGRFLHRDMFGAHERLSLRAATGGRYRALYQGTVRTGERLGQRATLELRTELERRPHEPFYGIGNSDGTPEVRHRQQHARAAGTLDVRLLRDLHIGIAGAITDLSYANSDDGPAMDNTYDPMTLTGWSGVRNLYGELELRWDSRRAAHRLEDPAVPSTGWLFAGYAGRVHQVEAGRDHWRLGADLQRFFRLGAGPRVLVLRLYGEAVTGTLDDVAFTELPQLGGNTLLRGYPRDRFRDRIATLGSIAYRWDLSGALAASLFVDTGRVYSSRSSIELEHLRTGYGIALQAHRKGSFIAEASLSSSIDGGVFVELAFDPVFASTPRVERR